MKQKQTQGLWILPILLVLFWGLSGCKVSENGKDGSDVPVATELPTGTFGSSRVAVVLPGKATSKLANALGTANEVTTVKVSVLKSSTQEVIAEETELTESTPGAGDWSVTLESLPVGVDLDFLGTAYNTNELAIFEGITTQALTENGNNDVQLKLQSIDDGISPINPRMVSVTLASEIGMRSTGNIIAFTIEYGGEVAYQVDVDHGNITSPMNGSHAPADGALEVRYDAPDYSVDGYITLTVTAPGTNSDRITTRFPIHIVSSAGQVQMSVMFGPTATAMHFLRRATELEVTVSTDPATGLDYLWRGDGNFTGVSGTTNPVVISGFEDTWSGTITATVTDGEGISASLAHTIIAGDFPYSINRPASGSDSLYDFEDGLIPSAFVFSGHQDWVIDNSTAYSGSYSIRSGGITHSQQSCVAITKSTAVGDLVFYFKTSTESGYDYLRFYVDDVQQSYWSGVNDWQQHTYTISTTGSVTYKWCYTKDDSISSYSDAVWLDLISFPSDGSSGNGGSAGPTTVYGDGYQPTGLTYPNDSGITWIWNMEETITWNNTDFTGAVDFYILIDDPTSLDDSNPDTLAANVNALIWQHLAEDDTNSGSHTLTVPTDVNGDTYRILMVDENGNWDINDNDFIVTYADGFYYEHVDQEGGLTSFEYTIALGDTPKDVFFIFTNENASNVTTPTTVTVNSAVSGGLGFEKQATVASQSKDLSDWARTQGIGLRGTPKATEFNAHPPAMNTGRAMTLSRRYLNTVGNTHSFKNESASDLIPATLRKIVTDSQVTLNIWVADDAWDSCAKWHCLDQTKVDAFAAQFLQPGEGNDIYDWVTNIFGHPWGSHTYSNLIPDTAAQSIDILFFDIDNDGNNTDPEPTGGVCGFFWAKDNYLNSSVSFSNERLIFYMDSVLSAKPEGGSWDISDDWPSEMVSTLAHEFQHMIHFYQKAVTWGASSETWINEMASMATEDLLADKLGVNGPRGVAYDDATAGGVDNTRGRLPLYNAFNYISPTVWYSGSNALISYSSNYAFGAYLSRNYGGAEFFGKMVKNEGADHQAITQALDDLGYSESFTSLLQKWGVAVLLSDQTDMSQGYRYNTGGAFLSAVNETDYQLGSINLFNYYFANEDLTGPNLFAPAGLAMLGGHYQTSNTYVQVGSGVTGTFSSTVDMTAGVRLTVVVK
jgi:hypothetical protein